MIKLKWTVLNLLLLMFQTYSSFAGKVFFLHGTGCAGKTSLCRELEKQSDEWHVVSDDDIYYEKAQQRWKEEFPHAFKAVELVYAKENILHAVMRNQRLPRIDASVQQREEADQGIEHIQKELNSRPKIKGDPNSWSNKLREHITQEIKDIGTRKHVIVDSWFLGQKHIDDIAKEHEVTHIMAYSPFMLLVTRTMQRNHDAFMNGHDISTVRFFHQALESFIGLYDFSDVKDGSIGELNKQEFLHGCDLVELNLSTNSYATGATKSFTRGDFSLEEFAEYRQRLLSLFKGDTLYLHPKRKIDRVIRTDQYFAADCAKMVIELAKE